MKNKPMRLLCTVISVIFIIGVLGMNIYENRKNSLDRIVAYAEDIPISWGLLQLVMQQNRAEVASFYKEKYNVEFSKDFWNTQIDGQTPYDYLMQKSLERCRYIVYCQRLAEEEGIAIMHTYSEFVESWQEENARRKALVEQGGIIYGPIEYSESDYFTYYFSNLEIHLKNVLGAKLEITDEELRAFYEDKRLKGFEKDFHSVENELRKEIIENKVSKLIEAYIK